MSEILQVSAGRGDPKKSGLQVLYRVGPWRRHRAMEEAVSLEIVGADTVALKTSSRQLPSKRKAAGLSATRMCVLSGGLRRASPWLRPSPHCRRYRKWAMPFPWGPLGRPVQWLHLLRDLDRGGRLKSAGQSVIVARFRPVCVFRG